MGTSGERVVTGYGLPVHPISNPCDFHSWGTIKHKIYVNTTHSLWEIKEYIPQGSCITSRHLRHLYRHSARLVACTEDQWRHSDTMLCTNVGHTIGEKLPANNWLSLLPCAENLPLTSYTFCRYAAVTAAGSYEQHHKEAKTDGNKRYLYASVVTAVSTFADTVISRSQHCLFNQAVFQVHISTGFILRKTVRAIMFKMG